MSIFLLLASAFAVPVQMTQQGRLLDVDGKGLTGSHELTFTIFDDANNGYEQWTESQTVQFNNGYYAVVLGSDEENNPLDDAVFTNSPLWLELVVNGEELEPRHQLTSVPYAQIAGVAEVAESVDGGSVNASDISVNGTPVVDGDGNWVGTAPTVDFNNLDNIPEGLLDGDDDTQLDEQQVEDFITNGEIDLATNSKVGGSNILTEDSALDWNSLSATMPTDIADGDDDTLAGISCATGEILSWDGNNSWVCTSDATLEWADVEDMLVNNPVDLNAGTTIGGNAIVTSVDDSDTLMGLSCGNGEVAKYDDSLMEWYCDIDIDTDTVLSDTEVLGFVNGQALSLASGTQIDGSDVVTVDTFASNLPADLADGDANTQLGQSDVVSYVEAGSVNLASGSQMDGNVLVTQPSGCTDGQILVFNFATQAWACGEDTDTTLTATEMQTMIESMTLNMANYPSVNGSPVLTESSTLDPEKISTVNATANQILKYDGQTVSWEEESGGESCTIETILTSPIKQHIQCGDISYVVNGSAIKISSIASEGFVTNNFYCALQTTGNISCWGYDYYNQVSDTPSGTFTAVSTGREHACGITSTGTVQCWGNDQHNVVSNTPSGTFTAISSGLWHTCGLTTAGTVQCWGSNSSNVVNNTPSGTFSSLFSGEEHTCALNSTGGVECWGYSAVSYNTPSSGSFSVLSSGEAHVCAINSASEVQCWGSNGQGQCNSPTGTFIALSSGGNHTCGIKSSGELECWGYHAFGIRYVPSGSFTSLSSGEYHACALNSTGGVECWGSTGYSANPPNSGTFVKIQANNSSTCGILESGNAVCWGNDAEGQLSPP